MTETLLLPERVTLMSFQRPEGMLPQEECQRESREWMRRAPEAEKATAAAAQCTEAVRQETQTGHPKKLKICSPLHLTTALIRGRWRNLGGTIIRGGQRLSEVTCPVSHSCSAAEPGCKTGNSFPDTNAVQYLSSHCL